MRLYLLLIFLLLLCSCGSEQHYFHKSLSKADKTYLSKYDTLTKHFSGKANWYRQYWTGDLMVKRVGKDLEIRKIGQWHQTNKEKTELYTITNFDRDGFIIDEDILGNKGMPPTGQTRCVKDTVGGVVRLNCEYTNRHQNGQMREHGRRIIIGNRAMKEGRWEYYDENGSLTKVVEYKNDEPVR